MERTLLDGYKRALGAFLARPEDKRLRAAYDDAVTALGARYRAPGVFSGSGEAPQLSATEFSIECLAAFELALQGYERALSALNCQAIDLVKRNKKLRDSNEALNSFCSTAAHDLQAPLQKIIGFGAILKQRAGAGLPFPAADALERIQDSAARMGKLLENLLAYSRAAPSAIVSRHRFNLRVPAEEAVSDLELIVRRSGAEIEIGRLDDVSGDPVEIRQLLQNLISNALKFHRPGAKPKIGISSVRRADGRVELSVRDNGIGFDEKYLKRILKPLHRLNPPLEFEGSGLGLAICAKIAARHGAAISARSSPGKGAEFIVTFPAIRS